jgi:salicylate 5-hydroxylase large subunit
MHDDRRIARAQDGFRPAAAAAAINEMGGRDHSDADHMVTDVALRALYRGYRRVMDL